MQLKAIVVLGCCALAAASDLSTPRPDLGNLFAVYPGWDMSGGDKPMHSGRVLRSGDNGGRILKSTITLANVAVPVGFVSSLGLIGGCGTFSPVGPTICQTVNVRAPV
ncbi:hypothetical protein GGX14DRAFT_405477 [Mycena pura]|uniref:Uncharacterized protein n=1 Tax=Mycena pura TaxID=153505 RepID=A0AAD6US27_9AGAR|nr:hypothetical protein GGX14DRAFT_405477 [Mycena pura]